MLKNVSSKCVCITFLRKEIFEVNRCYSNYITYNNGLFKSKRTDDEIHKKFNTKSNVSFQTTILPSQSQIVIAGAGTVANSVAYHLVINGWNDVLVLEQNRYTFI